MNRALIPLCAVLLVLAAACSGGNDGDDAVTETPIGLTPPAIACSPTRSGEAGDSTTTITSGGIERSYSTHVPASYDGATPVPVVLVFHGFEQTGDFIKGYTRFADLGEEGNVITVFPNGTGEPVRWNEDGDATAADDVQFTRDLLSKIQSDLCIDADRVYLAGYSNGGGMAQRVACDLADRVAALGTVAATYINCRAQVPWVAFHGIEDPLVPFEGGLNPPERGGGTFASTRRALSEWARDLGCDGLGRISRPALDVELTTFVRCPRGDGEALLYSLIRGGHTWPGAYELPPETVGATSPQIDATKAMWEFFVDHPLTR